MTGPERTAGATGSGRTRRDVLAAAGASGLVGLAGCLPGDDGENGTTTPTPTEDRQFANQPVSDDTLRVGVSVPTTGIYQGEGEQLLAGYELAAANINRDPTDSGNNVGFVANEHFEVLGDAPGVLGRQIELVPSDTRSLDSGARQSAEDLVDNQDVHLLVGGASSDEAIAHQEVARDRGVIHMIGFAPGNTISGSNCELTGFQEMFNAGMAAQALRPVLVSEYGRDASFAQVAPDSDVGETFLTSMRSTLSGAGWNELTAQRTRVGTQNFRPEIQTAVDQDPEVLVLNYYGLDGAHALTQAADITEGTDVQVVVPLYNRPMARDAGSAMGDVLGTIHWESGITQDYSRMFTQTWQAEYLESDRRTTNPSGIAHLAYCQLFQYAAAVERAGSFEPPAVVDALEGFAYDLGMGDEEMRACDHSASRPVPIVRGLPDPAPLTGQFYEVEDIITGVGSSCQDPPAADCELGSFEDAA